MGLLLLFGGVGLFAARSVTARAGAGSPEAAASGLLGALDKQDLERAAGYLDGEERQAVTVYASRLAKAIARRQGKAAPGDPLALADLSARNVRFQRVAGSGDVAVLELTGGTVGLSQPGGLKVELPVDEARRRLAEQTKGALSSFRIVTLRSGGRWYVSLLATAAEWGRLASHAGPVDYALLAAAPAGGGAASPEAAVRALVKAATTGTPSAVLDRLVPEERRVAAAYREPLLARAEARAGKGPGTLLGGRSGARGRVEGLTMRTEPVADGVARVVLTGGTLVPSGVAGARPEPLPKDGHAAVVVVERDGAWYPSGLFSAVDALIASAEREQGGG